MAASPSAPEPPRRVAVPVIGACDNRCVFCGRHGLEGDAPPLDGRDGLAARLAAARVVAEEVTLVGGEPTLRADLPAIVALARRLGFAAVGVQSHGRHLDRAGLAGLVDAGLSDLHLSIHGDAAAVHDFHTGTPGSFGAALAAAAAARDLGVVVAVATVLTRSNCRSLAGLPERLLAAGARAWAVAVPEVAGRALLGFEAMVPRLGLALPHALHALAHARRRGLPAFVVGAPLCALGPHRAWALAPGAGAPARAFAPACAACPARAACPGLDPAYLGRFAGDEVGPAQLRPAGPADPPAVAALRRLFVGAGALARDLRPLAEVIDPPRGTGRERRVLSDIDLEPSRGGR